MSIDSRGNAHRPAGAPARAGGQFATRVAATVDIDLGATHSPTVNPLENQSPADIDTVLAHLWGQAEIHRFRRAEAMGWLRKALEMPHASVSDVLAAVQGETRYRYQSSIETITEADKELAVLAQQTAPLNDEFERRGGWTRAFLVCGSDGHVHSSMHCSTCNRGDSRTKFQWMTEYSGADETRIVADAGWRACTICYPSAPLGVTGTKMFSTDEIVAAQARQNREDAKAARLAKAIAAGLTDDGSEFEVRYIEPNVTRYHRPDPRSSRTVAKTEDVPRTEAFKTERAAVTWATDALMWRQDEKAPAIRSIAQAVANKHGRSVEDVLAEFDAKAAKKRQAWG